MEKNIQSPRHIQLPGGPCCLWPGLTAKQVDRAHSRLCHLGFSRAHRECVHVCKKRLRVRKRLPQLGGRRVCRGPAGWRYRPMFQSGEATFCRTRKNQGC